MKAYSWIPTKCPPNGLGLLSKGFTIGEVVVVVEDNLPPNTST
jgi:hypothetical protein